MATVHLTAEGRAVRLSVPESALLSEILRDRGQAPAMPCAGRGRCGKCRVTASGALSAGLQTLLHTAGLACSDVAELAVAGGFGSYLDAGSAGRIGLLPRELVPKVRVLGNAALGGGAMLLLDRCLAPACEALARSARTLELSANPVFTRYYTEGMFF